MTKIFTEFDEYYILEALANDFPPNGKTPIYYHSIKVDGTTWYGFSDKPITQKDFTDEVKDKIEKSKAEAQRAREAQPPISDEDRTRLLKLTEGEVHIRPKIAENQ